MKITCNREKLLQAFQTAAMVAPARSPKPILQNIKLEITSNESGSGTAILTATDLEISIAVELSDINVEQSGSILLPVDRFGRILRESSDDELKIRVEGTGTIVEGERSEFRLPGANVEEYPVINKFTEEKYQEIPARLLKEMIRRTLFSVDSESSRYALGGVLLETAAGTMTAVGTDGRRLARMQGPYLSVGAGDEPNEINAIVPARAMQMIERALGDDDAEVKVAAHDNDILVSSPRVTIQSRLVEGRFPRWRDVFPDSSQSKKIELTVGVFHSAVRQAMITTSEESRGVNFTFGEGMMVLAAQSAETGQSHVELPISCDDEKISIVLDPKFVSDFLRVLDTERMITLDLIDAESAAVFHTDDGYSYVVMPLAKD